MSLLTRATCGVCPERCPARPAPLGDAERSSEKAGAAFVVALAGNPNTGKSTVFNHLTGMRQHTGNWPGKTVARAVGTFDHGARRFRLVDLPGTYSLLAESPDETVARDFLLFGRPDCTVVVCDATALQRNLPLVLQIAEITDDVVVVVNLVDEARRKGISIDCERLEDELGVPVVPTVARIGRGLDRLAARIDDVVTRRVRTAPKRLQLEPDLESAVGVLADRLRRIVPEVPCPRWLALRLLDGDEHVERVLIEQRPDSPRPLREEVVA